MADSKEAAALERSARTALRKIERRVVKKALRKLEDAAARAMTIDDDGRAVPEPERADHIAKDLRRSKRNVPYYVDVLLRRTEHAERMLALKEQAAPVQLNIGAVQVVVPPSYPILNIDVKE